MANIEIYTKATCPFCIRAKALLNSKGVTFHELPIDGDAAKREEMIQRSGRTTVPQILLMRSTLAAVTTCMRLIHVVDLIPSCANFCALSWRKRVFKDNTKGFYYVRTKQHRNDLPDPAYLYQRYLF